MVTAKRTAGEIGWRILVLCFCSAGSNILRRKVYVAESIRTIRLNSLVSSSCKTTINYNHLPTIKHCNGILTYEQTDRGTFVSAPKKPQSFTYRLQFSHQSECGVGVVAATDPGTHPVPMYSLELFTPLSKQQFIGDNERRNREEHHFVVHFDRCLREAQHGTHAQTSTLLGDRPAIAC